MSKPIRRSIACAYCGGSPANTRDHIPAKTIFPDPRNLQLVTVPSCKDCNNGASEDDEYFRDVVVQYHRVADLPEVQPLIEKLVRSLQRPEQAAYANARYAALTTHTSATGEPVPAIIVDPDRLKRVVGRYIRGLHFATFDLRVDPSWDVHVLVHPEQLNAEQEKFYSLFGTGTLRVIQEGVFWYVHARPVDHPTASAWLLIFFDNFPVFGFVRPPV